MTALAAARPGPGTTAPLPAKSQTPSWGQDINYNQRYLTNLMWWMSFGPGIAIFIAVFAFNFLGDALRDWLHPQFRRRAYPPLYDPYWRIQPGKILDLFLSSASLPREGFTFQYFTLRREARTCELRASGP